MRIKATILFLCLSLTACKSEKQILCNDPISTNGSMKVVNRQCILFGNSPVALIELENTNNHEHFTYTMNVVEGRIILNLNTSQAASIEAANNAQSAATTAMAMSTMNMMNSSSGR